MKIRHLLFAIALLFCVSLHAQETPVKQTIDSGTIENQFDYLITKSHRWKEFKSVRITWLDKLKKSVADSLDAAKNEINNTKNILIQKETEIASLSKTLETTKNNVTDLNNEKDSINFFGILLAKPLYNSILWSIIGALLAVLILYVLRFNRNNTLTKETKDKFDELEREYEGHRQRSLEREQQIRRKLQDEINKQKKDK